MLEDPYYDAAMKKQRQIRLRPCALMIFLVPLATSSLHGAPPDQKHKDSKKDQHLKRMFDAFIRWRSVEPIIDGDELERLDGAVVIRFRLRNNGTETVSLATYKPHLVAGTYHTHPSGDPYLIEGAHRRISIWFYPAAYHRDTPSVCNIEPGEVKTFVTKLDVPADMPNPVKTGVFLKGPFEELNESLGEPRRLKWTRPSLSSADHLDLRRSLMFKVGEIWTYKTRQDEQRSRLTIINITPHDKGDIYGIALNGLSIRNPSADTGITKEVSHLPMSYEALRKSVVARVAHADPESVSLEGYREWKEEFEKGNAGVFTVTVEECVNFMEQALNQDQD